MYRSQSENRRQCRHPNHKVGELINPSHSLKLEASSGEHPGHYYIPSTETHLTYIPPDCSWQTSLINDPPSIDWGHGLRLTLIIESEECKIISPWKPRPNCHPWQGDCQQVVGAQGEMVSLPLRRFRAAESRQASGFPSFWMVASLGFGANILFYSLCIISREIKF